MSVWFLVPWDPARGGLGYVLGEAGKEGRKERPSDAAPPWQALVGEGNG